MSLINTEIPAFAATAYHNGKFVPVTEQNFKGKWSVVVFYPADFTFVCPTELGDLADNYPEFQKLGAEVYGVSTDTHFTHKAWHDTSDTIKKVQYPLIGDPSHQLRLGLRVALDEPSHVAVIDAQQVMKDEHLSIGRRPGADPDDRHIQALHQLLRDGGRNGLEHEREAAGVL